MLTEPHTRPAILGGPPALDSQTPQSASWPILTYEDEQAVLRILKDGNLSTHPVIRELESDYCRLTGRRWALAHNNGTAALLAAFHALGLQPGDEVLVPSATFWASVLPMLWLGALPVFAECEENSLGLDPKDLEKKITPNTRALVLVHLWGLPCDLDGILKVAKKHRLKIIEDASHAHGAFWQGRPVGSFGDVSVFSLQGDKLAPGGEGGVLLGNDSDYFERAACLGDISRIIELETPARRFAATGFGMKTRIAPLSAALARSQLARLKERNQWRNQNLVYLSEKLEALGVNTFLPDPETERVYFEFIVRADPLKTRLPVELLIEALRAEGVEACQPRYPLLHQQPFFTEGHFKSIARLGKDRPAPDYRFTDLPRTQAVNQQLVKLPLYLGADRATLDATAGAFEKILAAAPLLLAKWNQKEDSQN